MTTYRFLVNRNYLKNLGIWKHASLSKAHKPPRWPGLGTVLSIWSYTEARKIVMTRTSKNCILLLLKNIPLFCWGLSIITVNLLGKIIFGTFRWLKHKRLYGLVFSWKKFFSTIRKLKLLCCRENCEQANTCTMDKYKKARICTFPFSLIYPQRHQYSIGYTAVSNYTVFLVFIWIS